MLCVLEYLTQWLTLDNVADKTVYGVAMVDSGCFHELFVTNPITLIRQVLTCGFWKVAVSWRFALPIGDAEVRRFFIRAFWQHDSLYWIEKILYHQFFFWMEPNFELTLVSIRCRCSIHCCQQFFFDESWDWIWIKWNSMDNILIQIHIWNFFCRYHKVVCCLQAKHWFRIINDSVSFLGSTKSHEIRYQS